MVDLHLGADEGILLEANLVTRITNNRVTSCCHRRDFNNTRESLSITTDYLEKRRTVLCDSRTNNKNWQNYPR